MTVLKVKSGAGGTWEEVGGIGLGVPAGGTTGQILTKTSAADYATAWTSTPPILANNSFLQGYRADGTTPANLIGTIGSNDVVIGYQAPADVYLGFEAVGHIRLGHNLPAGKQVYVPRLTVQGPLTLSDQQWLVSSGGMTMVYPHSPSNKVYFAHNANCHFNVDAGSTTFQRNVDIIGTLYKNTVAYTHPDFVFEHHFTGGIERFRDAPGADTYEGLWPLARVEEFAQEHWRLPGHAARENDRVDIFRRTHDLLAELERAYLHLFDHEKRLAALEGR